MRKAVYIIAEAGVNHNGSAECAFDLVDAAHAAGADCVKFQTFDAVSLASSAAAKAPYQTKTTDADESQQAMLRRLELPKDCYPALIRRCTERGMGFLSTPFEAGSLRFLLDLNVTTLKVSSGDLTNAPLLLDMARSGSDIILSTGMGDLTEVEQALGVLVYGYGAQNARPGRDVFVEAWNDPVRRGILRDKVTLLHCTTEYPTPIEDVNLMALRTLRDAFGLAVGYSDHSEGIIVASAAVALGATVIEKHLTLDRTLPGPDHAASVEPPTFKAMVENIRLVEAALGDGVKAPRPSEMKNLKAARKSVVAARQLREGEIVREGDLALKRPGHGVSPYRYWDLIGVAADRDYNVDETFLCKK